MKKLALLILLPALLTACAGNDKGSADEATHPDPALTDSLMERGEFITQSVFDTLRINLMGAVGRGGFEEAVSFCNVAAMPLTSQLEASFGVQIRRATDKPRNPSNQADEIESQVMAGFRDSIETGKPPRALLEYRDGSYHFYKPIFIMGLCLNCHGERGMTLNPGADTTIQRLYPADMATGYADKALRGTWHITFPDGELP